MPSLSGLMAEAAALRCRAKTVRSELRVLERKRASELSGGERPATPWMRAVALKVFALSGCFADVAAEYLQSKGRRALARDVQAWFDDLSAEAAAALVSPPVDDAKAARQLAEAKRFMAEKDLVTWVQQQNEVRGIAPTPGAVLDNASKDLGFCGRRNEQRRRLRRIMTRWGCRKGLLSGGDRLTKEAFQQKVGVAGSRVSGSICGPKSGPILGTARRSLFWDLCLILKLGAWSRDRLAVPILGPFLGSILGRFSDSGAPGMAW